MSICPQYAGHGAVIGREGVHRGAIQGGAGWKNEQTRGANKRGY